ncbi:MAG TPA: NADH-quinone oxidoreductase subunit C [Anaerolineales bacterium]|nr:NADH-quinone oxidoreductase subunit C [Anaerolineales bacterium]
MDVEKDLMIAESLLEIHAPSFNHPEPHRLDVEIETGDLLDGARVLVNSGWGYLSAVTGLDLGVEAGEFEVLYHFCAREAVTTLRVRVPRVGGVVPSLFQVIPSAGFYERELAEMFGITVEGAPDSSRLFLPDAWPEGVYPLRKDYEISDSGN